MERVHLFGFDFHSSDSFDTVLSYLSNWQDDRPSLPILITPNVDQIVKFSKPENSDLRSSLQNAAIVLPDGQPIVWTSKLKKGDSLKSRLTGSDLFPLLWNQLKQEGKSVFFILPNSELGEAFKSEYDSCSYFAPPYFNLDNSAEYMAVLNSCISAIETLSPDHVMIGLGFPKQERLALDLHEKFSEKEIFYHLLGASFEFYHGKKQRAPLWMQKMGLEFLHRLFREPRRMVKRYLLDDLAFIPLLVKELRN